MIFVHVSAGSSLFWRFAKIGVGRNLRDELRQNITENVSWRLQKTPKIIKNEALGAQGGLWGSSWWQEGKEASAGTSQFRFLGAT